MTSSRRAHGLPGWIFGALAGWGPSAHAGWVSIQGGECVQEHPDGHRLEKAQDRVRRRDDLGAVEAELKARTVEELTRKVCAARGEATCAAIRRRVGLDSAYDPDSGLVCVVGVVATEVVEDPDGHRHYETSLDALAGRLAASLDGAAWVEPGAWGSGCGAGEVGEDLGASLRARLVSAGVTLNDAATTRVVPRLTAGHQVTLELRKVEAGVAGSTVVGGSPLSAAWLGLHGESGEDCASDALLGLDQGARPSSTGLGVELSLSAPSRMCPGTEWPARLRPSAPAYVQLWSVGRSGQAWLTWSSLEEGDLPGGRLERHVDLTLRADHLPELGEERLVALASSSAGDLPDAQAGCRLERLDVRELSDHVAVVAEPFAVAPPGRGSCSSGGSGGASWAAYLSAPTCVR